MRAWNVTQLPRACRTRAGGRTGGGRGRWRKGRGREWNINKPSHSFDLWPCVPDDHQQPPLSGVPSCQLWPTSRCRAAARLHMRRLCELRPSASPSNPPPTPTPPTHTHPRLPFCRCLNRFTHFVWHKRWGKAIAQWSCLPSPDPSLPVLFAVWGHFWTPEFLWNLEGNPEILCWLCCLPLLEISLTPVQYQTALSRGQSLAASNKVTKAAAEMKPVYTFEELKGPQVFQNCFGTLVYACSGQRFVLFCFFHFFCSC